MKNPRLPLLLLAFSLAATATLADPVHQHGNDGAWRHEYSGWMFPTHVGAFSRTMQPYTIDGNSDVGVQYRAAGSAVVAVVEVFVADSAAVDAKLEGAKASAASKAGGSTVESEQPFEVDSKTDVHGVKITYAADAKSAGARTNLYYFTSAQWHVKVFASTTQAQEAKALDAFVQALPWDTLGAERLH